MFRWISAQPEFPPSLRDYCSSERNPSCMCMYVDNANNEMCLHCCTLRLMSLPTCCLKWSNQNLFSSALMIFHRSVLTLQKGCDLLSILLCKRALQFRCGKMLWQKKLLNGNFCKMSMRFYSVFTLASTLGKRKIVAKQTGSLESRHLCSWNCFWPWDGRFSFRFFQTSLVCKFLHFVITRTWNDNLEEEALRWKWLKAAEPVECW